MNNETGTPSPDAEETASVRGSSPEQDNTISISDDSPMTAIMLQQALRNLERAHMSWINEGPKKTGFDPRVIEMRIMKNLLIDKRADFDEIARQIREMYGDNVTQKSLENAWKKIRAMLDKWNG